MHNLVLFILLSISPYIAAKNLNLMDEKLARELDAFADNSIGVDLPASYIFEPNKIDSNKAIIVASVFHARTSQSTVNGIPLPSNTAIHPSVIVLKNLKSPELQYYLAGVDLFSSQIPAGEYYISSIRAGTKSDSNWIARIAVAGKDDYSNYGYLKLAPGEVVYVGHIQTHNMRKFSLMGHSPEILHPKYVQTNNIKLAQDYIDKTLPSLSSQLVSRSFNLAAKKMAEYATGHGFSSITSDNLVEAIEAEKYQHLARINADNYKERVNGYKLIFNSWSTDEHLYDEIESKLRSNLHSAIDDKYLRKEMVWATKTLGGSGNPKYRNILKEINEKNENSVLRSWSNKSLTILQQRQQLMPLIGNYSSYQQGQTPNEIRIINMITADDEELQLRGVTAAYKARTFHKRVMEPLKEKLLNDYKQEDLSRYRLKTNILICKLFYAAKNPAYLQLLPEIIDHSGEKDLKRYAEKFYKASLKHGLIL